MLSGSQQIEFYIFKLEMILVMDKTCLENDELGNDDIGVKLVWNVQLCCVESIVLTHLHLESTIRLGTCEETDLRSFISHIKLSLENKTRVVKNEKLGRPQTEDLDRNHQLFKLVSVLDTVSRTLKMFSFFRAT